VLSSNTVRSPCCASQTQPKAVSDSTIQISPGKAKELSVSSGDVVVLIGRRRRAAYARVELLSSKDGKKRRLSCVVPESMARNLRLRQDDAVKVVPLKDDDEAKSERSGDLVLLQAGTNVPALASVTLSPIADSFESLQASEGEMSDEEIQERFVKPYTEDASSALFKLGSIITLVDDNGRRLDFIVSSVELEQAGSGESNKEDEQGTLKESGLFSSSPSVLTNYFADLQRKSNGMTMPSLPGKS
jgi:hypothetical protein